MSDPDISDLPVPEADISDLPAPEGYLSSRVTAAKTVGSDLVGGGEALLHYGSGALAQTGAAGASLAAMAFSPWGKKISNAKQAIEDIEQAGTYQPRTEQGKAQTADIDKILGYPGRLAGRAVNAITGPEGTQHPYLAAAASTGIQAAPIVLGAAAGEGIKALQGPPKSLADVSQDVADRAVASSPQSQGAAQSALDVRNASPEVQQAFLKAAQKTGGAVNPAAAERILRADKLGVAPLTEGQALADPALISEEMNNRGAQNAFVERYADQNRSLVNRVTSLRDEVGPDVFSTNPTEHGDTLIGAYKEFDNAKKAAVTAKYDAAKAANGGDLQMDGGSFVADARAALKPQGRSRFLPSQVNGILDDVENAKGSMSLDDFEGYRTQLGNELRKAQRSGDGNAVAAISKVRDALEEAQPIGETAKAKALFDQARAAHAERMKGLEADPAMDAAVHDEVPPDRFVQKFVTGNSATRDGVATMRQNLKDNPTAVQTLGVATVDHLRRSAGIDDMGNGNFTQAGYNRQLQALGPRMKSLVDPKTAGTLQDLGDYARDTQFQPRGSYVNTSNSGTALIANAAKNLAEQGGNIAGFKSPIPIPLGSMVRKTLEKRAAAAAVERSLATGAGLDRLSDVAKK